MTCYVYRSKNNKVFINNWTIVGFNRSRENSIIYYFKNNFTQWNRVIQNIKSSTLPIYIISKIVVNNYLFFKCRYIKKQYTFIDPKLKYENTFYFYKSFKKIKGEAQTLIPNSVCNQKCNILRHVLRESGECDACERILLWHWCSVPIRCDRRDKIHCFVFCHIGRIHIGYSLRVCLF